MMTYIGDVNIIIIIILKQFH